MSTLSSTILKRGQEDVRSERELPDHLVRLSDGEWALWKCVGLRAAGFPVSAALCLASEESARAADSLIFLEERTRQARADALRAVRREIFRLKQDHNKTEPDALAQLKQLQKCLEKGRPFEAPLDSKTVEPAVRVYNTTLTRLQQAKEAFEQAYDEALRQTSERLRQVVADDRFYEALVWQNREAVHTGILPLLRNDSNSGTRTSRQRKQEELVASYVQRYSTKNDTIGFFGPVGWADITDEAEGVTVNPGPGLLASREVYFEVWCIDSVADAISKDERVKKYVPPRRMPYLHISKGEVYMPSRKWAKMTAREMMILQTCDGEMRGVDIARLMCDERGEYASHAEVYEELEGMERNGLVKWKLEVPVELYPERSLRKVLEGIEEQDVRRAALDKLEEMERRREAIKGAAGRASELEEAIREMEESYSEMTGGKARRSEGEMYAARTLVYEDCRRDIEVRVGRGVIEELGKPLGLMMKSARWYTKEAARELRRELEEVYREMVSSRGKREIDCATYWYRVQPIVYGRERNVMERAQEEFQRKWRKVLEVEESKKEQEYEYEEMSRRVEEEFGAESPGWKYARYHSPDVMIAARSVEEIERGDYLLVMGELHMGGNTLNCALFLAQHADPQSVLRNLEYDFPEPRAVSIVPKNHASAGKTGRFSRALVSPKDYRLEVAPQPSSVPRSQVLSIGDLVVEERAGKLVLRTRDGSVQFDIIEAFADLLTSGVMSRFKILSPGGHTPRLRIGKLVIQRESWGKQACDMEFAKQKEARSRFLGAREWRQKQCMPRHVFVKSPVEVKPMYVDFDSPIYVDLMSKVVRRTMERKGEGAVISVTEMLPGPEEVWLPDADDRRYTSELRFVGLDLGRQIN